MAKFCTRMGSAGQKNRTNGTLKTWLCTAIVAMAGGSMFFLSLQLHAGSDNESDVIEPGIIWYGVLKDGLAEAEESGKPILLVSAAPNCAGVSGLW